MTQIVADTFSRGDTAGNTAIANAAGWGLTASDGNAWATANPSMTWKITGDEGTATGTVSTTMALLGTATQAAANGLIRTKVSASGDKTGILLNFIDANNLYRFRLTNTQIIVDNVTGGVATNLITAPFTRATNTLYWMRAQVSGNTIFVRVWQDGVSEPAAWTATATDGAPLGAGQAGLLVSLSATGHVASFDSFLVVTPPVSVLATAIGRRGHRGHRGSHGRSY